MANTISSAPALAENSTQNISKKQQRLETKEARQEARATRRQEREAKRASKDGNTSPQIPSTPESAPAVIPPTNSGSTPLPSDISGLSTNQSSAPTPAISYKKSLVDLRGATIVNLTVQGTQGGSSFSVFASGKGPAAIDPTKAKTESSNAEAKPSSSATSTVNTVV